MVPDRLKRLSASPHEEGIEHALLSSFVSLRYFTGYRATVELERVIGEIAAIRVARVTRGRNIEKLFDGIVAVLWDAIGKVRPGIRACDLDSPGSRRNCKVGWLLSSSHGPWLR